MEYQKNIATNVYHGFGAIIALIVFYVMEIKLKTGIVEDSIMYNVLIFIMLFVFVYHIFSMKKLK